MVGRGRKNVPTHLKLVKGTAKNSKGEIYEIQPDLAFPMPPPHLSDEAKVEWGRSGKCVCAKR